MFGTDVEFQLLETPENFVFGASGKRFQSLISLDRLAYTFGEIKNGKLGLGEMPEDLDEYIDDPNDKNFDSKLMRINEIQFSSKASKVKKPAIVPFFAKEREKSL